MEFKIPEDSKEFVIPGDENDMTMTNQTPQQPIPEGRTSPFQGEGGLVRFSEWRNSQRGKISQNNPEDKENKNENENEKEDLQFDMEMGGRRKSKRKRKKKRRKTKKRAKKRKTRRKSRKRKRKRKTKKRFRNQRGCKR